MKSYRLLIFAAIVMSGFFLSCIKDGEHPQKGDDTEETEVRFSVILPGSGMGTRALTEADEYEVKTVEVLVFDPYTQQYQYTVYTDRIDNISGSTCDFTVKMFPGNYDLIILVNSRRWISHSFAGAIQPGTPKAQIENLLIAELPGKWSTDTSDPDYRAIPMWGEKSNQTIHEGTTFSVRLTRMLSSINVSLKKTVAEYFELKAVRLYNYNTAGRIIPDKNAENWDGSKAVNPTLPSGNYNSGSYLEYNSLTEPGESLIGEIYTFEAQAGTRAEFTQNTCLLIYGEFEGVNYYYRVDFQEKSSEGLKYIPLKRNHRYIVEIQKVSGPGFEDPDEAIKSLPVNFEAEIVEWFDPDMDNMEVDGEYYYSISPLEKIYWAEASVDNEIRILTNYQDWSYTVTDSPSSGGSPVSWITTSGYSQGTTHPSSSAGNIITYAVSNYTSGNGRNAYFHITAGRFSSVSKVTQYPWEIESISVDPIGTIRPEGEPRNIIIKGNFDATPVRATDLDTGQEIVGGEVPRTNGIGTSELEIPAWMSGQRTVAFEYFDARNNIWRIIRTEVQETDPTRSINVSIPGFTSGQAIDPIGDTFPLEISGTWPAMEIRAVDAVGNNLAATVQVTADTGVNNAYSITVHDNESWNQRYVFFQWSIDGDVWYTITTGSQSGYYIGNIEIDHTDGQIISRDGERFNVTVEGFYPELQLRASFENTAISTITYISAGTTGSTTIDVPSNRTPEARWINLEYSRDGGSNWIYISSGNQPTTYIVLYTGRVLALDYAGMNGNSGAEKMSWAEAMGIPTEFNSEFYYMSYVPPGIPVYNSDNSNYPGGTQPTGCNAYSEPGYPAGTWRCPTNNEINEMSATYGIDSWGSPEDGKDPTWARYGFSLNYAKTDLKNVRCVREPDEE